MYVSLHNRSAYSFNSALMHPRQLVEAAVAFGMPAIALTDLDGMYGAIGFYQACVAAGVRPILGIELHAGDGTALTLLAQGQAGYSQLCRLATRRHLGGAPLQADAIAADADDLIALVGAWPAAVPFAAVHDRWRGVFGDRLYIELTLHHAADVARSRQRARLADELGVPVMASCAARCRERHDNGVLQALCAIGTLTLLDESHPAKPTGAHHLRSPADMARLFERRPDALRHTLDIAERCHVALDLKRSRFPGFTSPDGRDAMAHLTELAESGCRRRYVDTPPQRGIGGTRPTLAAVRERLHRELQIIDAVHYAEYFLVFHDIVQYCVREGIATLARGSAADSLVCYALGVSHACPFRFDLPFDRFINPERARFSKMADIDLDLPWDRREQVIAWVYERYGQDHVAMIGSANTYRARGAVSDLGRIHGLAPSEIHQATRWLSARTSRNLATAYRARPESRDLPVYDEPYRTILHHAGRLQGVPRHWSMHPCGIVVSPEPLTDLVPVQRSPRGTLVAQYDMDAIEDLGFVKVDLLGQAGLAVLRDAVDEIARTTTTRVDLERDVDYSDRATWDLIAGGSARGVHHIESPAMTSLITQCQCRDIDCLTAVVAIIRPGAANQGKKEAFARRHQGFEAPQFAHPALRPVLESTYGLMVFEEHILQIAVAFADMNLGRADVLRRALNKQDHALIEELHSEFVAAATARGHDAAAIATIWQQLEGFSGFMFNKAHSAEYAIEAFQGAWLKRRWPAHYLAAILSNYRGFYAHSPTLPQILYVLEALRLGIGWRAPCVQRSRDRFSVESDADGAVIRVPIGHIQGLSAAFVERWWTARRAGPFRDLADVLHRCAPGPAEARLLLDSGALDALGPDRPTLFWQLQATTHAGPDTWLPTTPDTAPAMPIALTAPDRRAIARREMELLGFPIALHPLEFLGADGRPPIDWTRYVPLNRLGEHHHQTVTVCGLMVADRTNATRRGDLMKFVTLGDFTGFAETILFADVYQRDGHLLTQHAILAADAVVEPFENRRGATLRVTRLRVP